MNLRRQSLFVVATLLYLVPAWTWAGSGHEEGVFARLTLMLVSILTLAKCLGYLFEKIGIPELVGELSAGIVLGNLGLLGLDSHYAERILQSEFIQYAAELGVILLLFVVGLESSVRELLRVGFNAFAVAVTGVIAPTLVGYFLSVSMGITDGLGAWFIGATFAATSVGITAKVLREKGVLVTSSAQVILGAAVIDDVLGILLLAVLAGVLKEGTIQFSSVMWILIKAVLFFVGSYLVGQLLFKRLIRITSLHHSRGIWTGFGLIIALAFAQVAEFAGMAPIIGAFLAGLLLDDVHFQVGHRQIEVKTIEHLLSPLLDILLPIFFVVIGAQVKLATLGSWSNILLIAVLLVAAIITKAIAGGVVRGKGFDRWGVGLGMVPRGEVGLIFAAYAIKEKVLSETVYSVLVFVVLLTTVVGPILLKPRLAYFQAED